MTTHPHRRRRAAPAVWLLLILAALAAGLWLFRDPFPRLEVGGFRIGQEEYLRAMYQARNEVLSDHSAAGISLTDWQSRTDLGDPCRLVTDRAIEILTEYYAVSTLAVERGYLADPGYEAMLRDMEDVNAKRQQTLDAGGMVTGIPLFTVDDYIAYRTLNLRQQFWNDPANPENNVTEAELLERYQADRDNLYRQADSMELRFLLADGAGDALEQDFRRALEIGDLAAALEELPQLNAYYREISVTPATYSTYSRSLGDVLAWSAGLQTGQLSEVLRVEDRLCLIQCLERTSSSYTPLEEVESIVVQSIRESRYEELIAGRMEAMTVTGDPDALYRFTAEQLP